MLHGWYPRVVQLLGLGHTGATGQRTQVAKTGRSTGEHWQAQATSGLGRACAAEAGAGLANRTQRSSALAGTGPPPRRFRTRSITGIMLHDWYPREVPRWCCAAAVRAEPGAITGAGNTGFNCPTGTKQQNMSGAVMTGFIKWYICIGAAARWSTNEFALASNATDAWKEELAAEPGAITGPGLHGCNWPANTSC